MPTNYTYTGQYSYTQDFGLMFYNARWYDPSLGRFAQADSIVLPGVQGLDRYAYVNNSPMNYVDPSGHKLCDADGYCGINHGYATNNSVSYWKGLIKEKFGVTLSDDIDPWSATNASTVYFALFNQNQDLNGNLRAFSNGTIYRFDKLGGCNNGRQSCYDATTYNNGNVTFRSTGYIPYQNVYHEFAHVMDVRSGGYFSSSLGAQEVNTVDGDFVMGGSGDVFTYQRNNKGYANSKVEDIHFSNGIDAQQHPACANMTSEWCQAGHTPGEEWGDLWANYIVDNFSGDSFGVTRSNWVKDQLYRYFHTPMP